MRVDVKAIARLVSPPPPVEGCGNDLTEEEWVQTIQEVRDRLMKFSYYELCNLIRESYLEDLFCLVICHPYDEEFLDTLKEGMSEVLWGQLKGDCERHGPARLTPDHACTICTRMNHAMDEIEEERATQEQKDQILAFSQSMMDLPDDRFKFCVENLPIPALNAMFVLSGGLESPFSIRAMTIFNPKEQAWIAENYTDTSSEPIQAKDAEECITNFPALIAGTPWPKEPTQSPEEYAALRAEMNAYMDIAKNHYERTRWQELKLKISCWKCELMDPYYEFRDWLRFKFGSRK